MIVVLIFSVLFLFTHAIVGQRGLDNAIRLNAAIYRRIGVEPLPRPPHPLRHLASFVTSRPRRRRPWIALVALGMAKTAWQRGAICEQDLMRFDDAITSWTFRFGDELPDGRDLEEP